MEQEEVNEMGKLVLQSFSQCYACVCAGSFKQTVSASQQQTRN